jgi:hypothetical protein
VCFTKRKHANSWLVQLATGTKRKVIEVIEACPFEMNEMHTQASLNILPLGSYDMLINMDWLETHKVKLDCFNKTMECEDDEGNKRVLWGIQKPMLVRQISTLYLKKYSKKGCPLYVIHVLNSIENNKVKIEDHPVLYEFRDVFMEIPRSS